MEACPRHNLFMSLPLSTTCQPPLLYAMNFPEINPKHDFSYFNEGFDPPATEFQVSDYLMLDDGFGEDNSSSQSMASSEQVPSGSSSGYSGATSRNNSMQVIMMPTLDYSTATSSLICYFLKKKEK